MDDIYQFLVIVFVLCFPIEIQGKTACTATATVGEDDTSKADKDTYDTTTTNAVLGSHNDYRFDCCGYIESWEIYAHKDTVVPKDVTVQVWEDTGTLWNLVDENIITATAADSKNPFPITGTRIRVGTGTNDQHIGFYQHAGPVISYENGGQQYNDAFFASAQTSYNWDSANSGSNRDFGIHAIVVPSQTPTFTNLDDTAVVQNTDPGGTVVFTVQFSDADAEDTPTLAITSFTGSADSLFELNSATNEVAVRNGVTLTPGTHSLTFTVTDGCALDSSATLSLRIENVPPVITSLPSDTSESEDLNVRKLLHTLVVTDTDVSTITCSPSTTGVPFSVDKITGSTDWGIYYDASSTMDYQTQNAYILTVSCTDGYDSTSGEFTVNLILNQPPIINSLPLAVDISEDTVVETTLYTVSITDPENVAVDCTLTSTTPSTTFLYEKPSANHNERDFILASGGVLNYDSVRTYKMDITCNDGRRSDSNVFFVNVLRNQPPVFVNLQNTTSVSSISSYIGQIVFDVDVTDRENDQVEYFMTCEKATNCPFEIYHSGEIVLTRSVKGEFVPAYDLYVTVKDGKSTVGPRSLTVHILDINYVPVITNLPLPSSLVVSENSASGLSVFQVSVQDNDNGDTHTYTMTSSPSIGMLYFTVDASTGLVTTSTTNNINYEGISPTTTFTFMVTVTDTKDSASQNLSITIADLNEAPVFTKTSYVLATDEGPPGTVLPDPVYLFADEDPGDTHKYSMVCASNAGYFSISPSTGAISLTTELDVDGAGLSTSFTCTVTISDGSLTDTASLTINVNNVNDNTPAFSSNLYTYYVDINTAVNTVFGSTVATDGDIGTFGTFTYSIDQASLGTETFGIQSNGDVYLKASLTPQGYGQSLKFKVLATDTGSLQGSATVFVVIPQTTTTTTTTTDRPLTFIEYPPNLAWLVVGIVLGLIILFLPCFVMYHTSGPCTWKGRPEGSKEYTERIQEKQPENAKRGAEWNPWKWYQLKRR